LGFGLLPFFFGIGVGHDAGGGLHIEHAVLDDAGANGNSQVHFARVAQVASRTTVHTTTYGLQLINDFHGAYLAGAGQGARRAGGAQPDHVADAVLVFAAVVGVQVLIMRVAFHGRGVRPLSRALFGDATIIVASQLNQHQVFSAFFWIGLQFG